MSQDPITKIIDSRRDAKPVILHGKRVEDSELGYPILVTGKGAILITDGMTIPPHDERVINDSDPDNIIITYNLDSVPVGTKTIVTSGSTTRIAMSYA